MRNKKWLFVAAPLGLVLFVTIGGQLVKYLWNALLPGLFHFPQITFWQALGLLVLGRILFGGFGMHGHGSSRSGMRRRMEERWAHLSPEEREKCRAEYLGRWGRVAPSDSNPDAGL